MKYHELSAVSLHDLFMKGDVTAVTITTYFLDRIALFNSPIGAFLTVYNDRALKKAAELDRRRQAGEKLGPMAAIPIAIKDNIHVAGEITTCASNFLKNFRAPFDATVVKLLEDADAIILGKTNMDEFAMGSSTENSALMKTHNPWDLECTPGGSSGGSAAAVAARLVPIALGSDTGGSIRQPASLCGVLGFKPTYGRVSRFGLVAFGSSLDQIGPFANFSEDIALTMEVLGRHCEHDSTSLPTPPENYLEEIKKSSWKGVKVGIPRTFLKDLREDSKKLFEAAIEKIVDEGAEVVDVNLDMMKYSIAVYYILATAEASTNLARFDGIRYGVRSPEAKTLDEVYDLSKEEGFGPEVKRRILLGTFVLSAGYQDAYYKKAQKVRTLMLRQAKEAFEACDVIAMPTSPQPAFRIGEMQDPLQMYLEDIYTIGANLIGAPAISVPAAFSHDGKPVGIQFMGPQKGDLSLVGYAAAFERISPLFDQYPELVK
jgi:aspartyl-tRNA(Asn)/glutamyl-tRNA(Gln) amidotransferase subunit A